MAENQMASQERVKTAINHQIPDRVPVYDSPWAATVDLWRRQGMPEDVSVVEYFDYDMDLIGADLSPRLPIKTLDENDEYITETTPYGGIRRNHKDHSTTPEVIDCPIKKKDDWPAVRELLKPDRSRINWENFRKNYNRMRKHNQYICYVNASGYDLMQSFVKSEQLLMFMFEDPGWIKEIIDVNSELIMATIRMLYDEGFRFDAFWTYNDMGYKNSSLFSPKMYRTIIGPSDRKRNDFCHELGMQTILHSCGCVKGLIPDLIEHGFDCLQALEVKAGMDIRELKSMYGDRIAFFGNIDVMLMEDPDDSKIENEIKEKFSVAMPGGGYLFHSDHSIPKDVSFEKYKFVMQCVRKYGQY
ncbi:MAG: uroporphyrinogen decarboxylase family protein [Planctomycetota bacterium]